MNDKNYTYNEIMNQAETLESVYGDISGGAIDPGFLDGPYDEIILFGCGTDFNLCQSASFFTRSLMGDISSLALPSSELVINTETYIKKNKKYLLFGFSRSGETTESIEIIRKLNQRDNVTIFMFSAVEDSRIIELSDKYFICRGAVEKSVAMTKAYTGFLFAYCLMLAWSLNKKRMLAEFEYLVKYMKENIHKLFDKIRDYMEKNEFSRFFALGSGFNYGIAVEADLKMKEMSQTHSYSYYLHEFNHGPKTMVDAQSLCLVLTLNKDLFRIDRVLEDIIGLGPKILIVGGGNETGIKNKNVDYLIENLEFEYDLVKSFINIPVFQILAYIQATKKNVDPDMPKNLNFTTRI
jgi:glucosamine--fructose-6-phosphate aminotransferase (isomerizing)